MPAPTSHKPESVLSRGVGSRPADEDGYELWLRYRPRPAADQRRLRQRLGRIGWAAPDAPLVRSALAECQRALGAMAGRTPVLERSAAGPALLLATRAGVSRRRLPLADVSWHELGDEGYALRTLRHGGQRLVVVAANGERGLLYGSFALLRALNTGVDLDALHETSAPALRLRLMNHWDNLDRSVERGYAGTSIWDWWKLPAIVDERLTDYARANASLGLNGVVLNNVNARAEILSEPWLAKVAAIADVLRPWGQKVWLSVRFSSPRELGGLPTADPLDPAVRRWWAERADAIYRRVPDFGGWLVKANSEGQPGPQDHGRTHAEGAGALADALAPHGGLLVWRAFIYASDNPADRACQAYDEFVPLDGAFAPNVAVQVKNGAIDFQPREPFHPLFGAMQHTPLLMEFQLTKEYLGFSTHLAYLGTMWQEVLQAETHRHEGCTVAQSLRRPEHAISGIAGVANVGSDRTWCGSHGDQANWYAFGRLAWNPDAGAAAIATEWVRQTFMLPPAGEQRLVHMLMTSREAVVNYMTPLGLHHLMDTGHHHGPGPWVDDLKRPEWNPTYYHRADRGGIGFDRGPAGSNAVAQYAAPLAARWSDPRTTEDELLLWFHHLPWQHRLRSGRTLWHELIARYDRGVAAAKGFVGDWQRLRPWVDARRHREVAQHLAQQHVEAQWWRDACLAYFQSVNGLAWPSGARVPPLTVAQYRAIRFEHAPGRG